MPSDRSDARPGRRPPPRRFDVRDLWGPDSAIARALSPRPTKGRRVRRTIRHIEPWSVLKLALLFHVALFLIICVASALLWSGARASGTVDNLESFITSVGGFGNCEPIDGATPTTTTTTTSPATTDEVDQLNPNSTTDSLTDEEEAVVGPDEDTTIDGDEDCRPGERLVGAFKFEDGRIFIGFILGGIVLVLAGSGAVVVLVLLFNLMSDLVGGVEVTVIEEETRRAPPKAEDRVPSEPRSGGRPSSPRFPRRD
jgi:hypothetical protein